MIEQPTILVALYLMRTRGWRQGVPHGENDKTVCPNQALALVTDNFERREAAALRVCEANDLPVFAEMDHATTRLTWWNDAPGRAWPEVQAAFVNALEPAVVA